MTNLHRKQQLIGLLTVLIILLLSSSAVSLAQGGEQPAFTASVFTAANGGAIVEMQEAQLSGGYFSANGELGGLIATETGLILPEGMVAGAYTSGVIHSPLAAASDIVPLWDADLPPGAELLLETRLSLDGGPWSVWLPNPEAFYPVRDNQHGGNIIWVGGKQADIQFRLTLRRATNGAAPTLRSLTLFFNDASRGPTDAEIAAKMNASSQAVDACAKPEIVPRNDWGCPDGQNSPRRLPTYAPVTHIIIHQSETPNHTDPYQDWAGWVRSVWNYHANCLGWGDVGYNYLIDPAGNIYEGRAGGDDVIGIHDTHNRSSMGIGFLGCYGNCDDPRLSVAHPSPAMLDSATDLFAWKLNENEIDPHSQATYDYLPNIPVIAGGRDVTWTTSPGDNLYNQLPWLRDETAWRIDECQTPKYCLVKDIIFDKNEYMVGETINLTVKLVDDQDKPLGGAAVTAEVDITPWAANSAANSSIKLIDRTGDYDGSIAANTSGLYTFKITAEHPDFETCYGESSPVPVGKTSKCSITAWPEPDEVAIGKTVELFAKVTLDDKPVTDANVTASITQPDSTIAPPLSLHHQDDGVYQNDYLSASQEGKYDFTVTASGGGLEGCQPEPKSSSFTVIKPEKPLIKVEPEHLTASWCSFKETSAVNLLDAAEVTTVVLELSYNPSVVQVIDADYGQRGVQVRPDGAFLHHPANIIENEVDTRNGRIYFKAAIIGDETIDGDAGLILIDWRPQHPGLTDLTLDKVELLDSSGQVIEAHPPQNGKIEITSDCTSVSGVAALQGKSDYSGIVIASSTGEEVVTEADGAFNIETDDSITISYPGYLAAEAKVTPALFQTAGEAGSAALGTITLPGGDATQDDTIDIFDLALIASHYDTNDATADINGDSDVNIYDLVIAAGNYDRRGPVTDWQ